MDKTSTCRTCTRPTYSPYHVVGQDGKTIHGCIDPCHEAHLVPCTEYSRWFNRPLAKKFRRESKKKLEAMLKV